MTIHIITKAQIDQQSEFTASIHGDTLSVVGPEGFASISISIPDVVSAGGSVVVYWSQLEGFVPVSGDALVNAKELESYLRYAKTVNRIICTAVVNQQGDSLAVVFYEPINYDGNVVESHRHCTTAEAVDLVFPGTSELRLRHRKAKIRLLEQVGAHDSLASLEKQVDLLTRMVLAIANSETVDSNVVQALSRVLAEGDSVGAMSENDAATKITDFKKKLRQAQAEYFAARGA